MNGIALVREKKANSHRETTQGRSRSENHIGSYSATVA